MGSIGENHYEGDRVMIQLRRLVLMAAAVAVTASVFMPQSARAANIIEEWAGVNAPPAPELKPVTVDPKTTALLMLDFIKPNCTNRPRCMASIPAMKKLLTEARAKGVMVVYSVGGTTTTADIIPDIAPITGESSVRSSVDKFTGTDLEKILKDKGISSVIITGTAAHGAVLYTGSVAALKGLNVIVPVDGMSSEDLYYEQATAWLLAKGTGGIGPKVTLTKIDLIKF
jgi:nicotinamidase-related amidase